MITFKQFLEDIFVQGGELLAAVNDDRTRRASDHDRIVANRRPLGRLTGTTRETPVYYAFSFVPGDASTEMLKTLKGHGGQYVLPAARRDTFIKDAAGHMAAQFKALHLKPDVIVAPSSSSPLLRDFATVLAKELGVQVGLLNAFSKVKIPDLPADREQAMAMIRQKFIDYDYLEKKFKGDKDKAVADITKNVYYNIRKHGYLSAKELHKQYGKFVMGFLKHDLSGEDEYSLLDKTVLVVDDVLSSGSTFSELFRIARDELGAADVYGAALFARGASKPRDD